LDGDIYWINWRKDFLEQFSEQTPNGEDEVKKKEDSDTDSADWGNKEVSRMT